MSQEIVYVWMCHLNPLSEGSMKALYAVVCANITFADRQTSRTDACFISQVPVTFQFQRSGRRADYVVERHAVYYLSL